MDIKEKHKHLRSKYSDEEYIERLENTLLSIEMIAAHKYELPKNINTEKEEKIHSAINTIFRISHVARLPGCMSSHPEWEEERKQIIKNRR